MKLIPTIITLFSTINPDQFVHISSNKDLKTVLADKTNQATQWVWTELEDSIENQIILEMAQEDLWKEKLANWKPLTIESFKKAVMNEKLSILHLEIHRQYVENPSNDWICSLPMDEKEKEEFFEDFMVRFQEKKGGIQKQLLAEISNIHPSH